RVWACRPAALTTVLACSSVPSFAIKLIASCAHSAWERGVLSTTSPPAFSRSPCSASIRAWLSTMPVLGECTAATHSSCGSSALQSQGARHRQAHHARANYHAVNLFHSDTLKPFNDVDRIAAQRSGGVTALQHKHRRQTQCAQARAQTAEVAGLQRKFGDRVF